MLPRAANFTSTVGRWAVDYGGNRTLFSSPLKIAAGLRRLLSHRVLHVPLRDDGTEMWREQCKSEEMKGHFEI